jgi:NodT family efflux transporter outer membrane factor (OMF) lipoprotein
MKRFSPLILVVLLASCATKPPERQPLETVTVPDEWSTESMDGLPADRWWEAFGSSNLNAVVQEALTNNYDIRIAAARLDAAIAQSGIEGAAQYPWLGFNFDAARAKQNFIGLPIPGSGGSVLSTHTTTYGANLTAAWELDVWGRVRSGVSAALAQVQATEADLAGARQSIAAQTAKAWLAVIEARQQVSIADARAESFETTARQNLRRYERGLASALDVRLAMTTAANAKSSAAQRQDQLQRVLRQYEILLGRYPDGESDLPAELPGLPPEIPAGLPSELLERRPDLVAAERRLASTDKRLIQAKRSLLPRISLTASGGTRTADLEDIVSDSFSVWTLAANVAQPLFEGGRLRANIALERANVEAAAAQYANAALVAFGEVEERLTAASLLAEQEARLVESLDQSRASLRLAEERYASGLEIILTVLTSQSAVFDAESSLATVRRQILDNRIDLHLALGGGFGMEGDVATSNAGSAEDEEES